MVGEDGEVIAEDDDDEVKGDSKGDEVNAFGGGDNEKDEEDKFMIQNLKNQKQIPPNLLSKPLPQDKQLLLNDEERRLYNIQKTKFDTAGKKIKKMPIHP